MNMISENPRQSGAHPTSAVCRSQCSFVRPPTSDHLDSPGALAGASHAVDSALIFLRLLSMNVFIACLLTGAPELSADEPELHELYLAHRVDIGQAKTGSIGYDPLSGEIWIEPAREPDSALDRFRSGPMSGGILVRPTNSPLQAPAESKQTAPLALPGETNLDCEFCQMNFFQVLAAEGHSLSVPVTWGEGDWDGVLNAPFETPSPGNGILVPPCVFSPLPTGRAERSHISIWKSVKRVATNWPATELDAFPASVLPTPPGAGNPCGAKSKPINNQKRG